MRASWQLSPCYYFTAFSRLVGDDVIALHFSLTIEAKNFSKNLFPPWTFDLAELFFRLAVDFMATYISTDTQNLVENIVEMNKAAMLDMISLYVWNEKLLWFSRFADLIPLELAINCPWMWIWAVVAVGGVCVMVVCRDSECLGRSRHRCWHCGSYVGSTLGTGPW